MNNIIVILEIAVLVILAGLNLWMTLQQNARKDRTNMEGFQKRENELNRMIANEAGEHEPGGRISPCEKYSSESYRTVKN